MADNNAVERQEELNPKVLAAIMDARTLETAGGQLERAANDENKMQDFSRKAENNWEMGEETLKTSLKKGEVPSPNPPLNFEESPEEQVLSLDECAINIGILMAQAIKRNPQTTFEQFRDSLQISTIQNTSLQTSAKNFQKAYGEKSETRIGTFLQSHAPDLFTTVQQATQVIEENRDNPSFLSDTLEDMKKGASSLGNTLVEKGKSLWEYVDQNRGKTLVVGGIFLLGIWGMIKIFGNDNESSSISSSKKKGGWLKYILGALGLGFAGTALASSSLGGGIMGAIFGGEKSMTEWIQKQVGNLTDSAKEKMSEAFGDLTESAKAEVEKRAPWLAGVLFGEGGESLTERALAAAKEKGGALAEGAAEITGEALEKLQGEYSDFLKKHPDTANLLPKNIAKLAGILGITLVGGLGLRALLGKTKKKGAFRLFSSILKQAALTPFRITKLLLGGPRRLLVVIITLGVFYNQSESTQQSAEKIENGWWKEFLEENPGMNIAWESLQETLGNMQGATADFLLGKEGTSTRQLAESLWEKVDIKETLQTVVDFTKETALHILEDTDAKKQFQRMFPNIDVASMNKAEINSWNPIDLLEIFLEEKVTPEEIDGWKEGGELAFLASTASILGYSLIGGGKKVRAGMLAFYAYGSYKKWGAVETVVDSVIMNGAIGIPKEFLEITPEVGAMNTIQAVQEISEGKYDTPLESMEAFFLALHEDNVPTFFAGGVGAFFYLGGKWIVWEPARAYYEAAKDFVQGNFGEGMQTIMMGQLPIMGLAATWGFLNRNRDTRMLTSLRRVMLDRLVLTGGGQRDIEFFLRRVSQPLTRVNITMTYEERAIARAKYLAKKVALYEKLHYIHKVRRARVALQKHINDNMYTHKKFQKRSFRTTPVLGDKWKTYERNISSWSVNSIEDAFLDDAGDWAKQRSLFNPNIHLSQKSRALEERLANAQEELRKTDEALVKQKAKAVEMQQEGERLADEQHRLSEATQVKSEELAKVRQELEAVRSQYRTEVETLRTQRTALTTEIQSLTEEETRLTGSQQERVQEIRKRLQALEKTQLEAEGQLDRVRRKIEYAEGKYSDLERTTQSLGERVRTQQSRIAELDQRIAKIDTDIATRSQTLRNLEAAADQHQQRIQDLEGQRKNLADEAHKLESGNEARRAKIAQERDALNHEISEQRRVFQEKSQRMKTEIEAEARAQADGIIEDAKKLQVEAQESLQEAESKGQRITQEAKERAKQIEAGARGQSQERIQTAETEARGIRETAEEEARRIRQEAQTSVDRSQSTLKSAEARSQSILAEAQAEANRITEGAEPKRRVTPLHRRRGTPSGNNRTSWRRAPGTQGNPLGAEGNRMPVSDGSAALDIETETPERPNPSSPPRTDSTKGGGVKQGPIIDDTSQGRPLSPSEAADLSGSHAANSPARSAPGTATHSTTFEPSHTSRISGEKISAGKITGSAAVGAGALYLGYEIGHNFYEAYTTKNEGIRDVKIAKGSVNSAMLVGDIATLEFGLGAGTAYTAALLPLEYMIGGAIDSAEEAAKTVTEYMNEGHSQEEILHMIATTSNEISVRDSYRLTTNNNEILQEKPRIRRQLWLTLFAQESLLLQQQYPNILVSEHFPKWCMEYVQEKNPHFLPENIFAAHSLFQEARNYALQKSYDEQENIDPEQEKARDKFREKQIPKPDIYESKLSSSLFAVAQLFGYTGNALLIELSHFFSEANKEYYGIYWNGKSWSVNDPSWFDKEGSAKTSQETWQELSSFLQKNKDRLFEARQDSLVDHPRAALDSGFSSVSRRQTKDWGQRIYEAFFKGSRNYNTAPQDQKNTLQIQQRALEKEAYQDILLRVREENISHIDAYLGKIVLYETIQVKKGGSVKYGGGGGNQEIMRAIDTYPFPFPPSPHFTEKLNAAILEARISDALEIAGKFASSKSEGGAFEKDGNNLQWNPEGFGLFDDENVLTDENPEWKKLNAFERNKVVEKLQT